MKEEENPVLNETVEEDSALKQMIVNYIGEQKSDTDRVTVEMAIDVFMAEFPEFLLAIAEENFIRGYQQALNDLDHSSPLTPVSPED